MNSSERRLQYEDKRYVIGVDIGGSNLRIALATMEGRIVDNWLTSTVGIRDPEQIVTLIAQGIDVLLGNANLTTTNLLALAAGAPGITDVDHGRVIATSYLMGWRDVPLRAMLETTLGVLCAVDNDVNLAAYGELRAGTAKGIDDFVFLALGTGVGAGVVIDGGVHRGYQWVAGEVGYMFVPGVSTDFIEKGSPGPLESVIGGSGISAQWNLLWEGNPSAAERGPGIDATATQIFDAALRGHPLASQLFDHVARTLAYAIYNITLILNCELVVLGGSVGMHTGLLGATRQFLEQQRSGRQTKIACSTLGTDAQIIGAVYLAVDKANLKPKSTFG